MTMTRTLRPWSRLRPIVYLLNKGFMGSLGGRLITSASSGSASKATEQAGSMISSKKTT